MQKDKLFLLFSEINYTNNNTLKIKGSNQISANKIDVIPKAILLEMRTNEEITAIFLGRKATPEKLMNVSKLRLDVDSS